MTQRLQRVSIRQTARVFGILYFFVGLLLLPFILLVGNASPDGAPIWPGFWVLLPIAYAVIGFVSAVIGGALYNWVAQRVGGVEFELEPLSPDAGRAGSLVG